MISELERDNEELRSSNTDLCDLLELAAGLAARVHDSMQLASYACRALERLIGGRVEVSLGEAPPRARRR